MKQHPILFSTPMVQAILAGNKTMTRRLNGLEKINTNPDDWQFEWADFSLKMPWRFTQISTVSEKTLADKSFYQSETKCPYGKPGDVLWVRETWAHRFSINGQYLPNEFVFKSTNDPHEGNSTHEELGLKWFPSIHMPKSACRLWLEITDIRVERLQVISEKDAKAEGVELQKNHKWKNYRIGTEPKEGFSMPFSSFETLWRKIHGGDSWNANPWVWVIEFKRIEKLSTPMGCPPTVTLSLSKRNHGKLN